MLSIDQYANFLIDLLCMSIIFSYLINQSNPLNYNGSAFVLSIFGLIFLILFFITWLGNLICDAIAEIKWNFNYLKDLAMIILNCLFGVVMIFLMVNSGLFENGFDINNSQENFIFTIVSLTLSLLNILASFIFYILARKMKKINKSNIFASIITVNELFIFISSNVWFGNRMNILFYFIWFIVLMVPITILIIKYAFKNAVIDFPVRTDLVLVGSCLIYVIGYSAYGMAFQAAYGNENLIFYICGMLIGSVTIILSAFCFICIFKDDSNECI